MMSAESTSIKIAKWLISCLSLLALTPTIASEINWRTKKQTIDSYASILEEGLLVRIAREVPETYGTDQEKCLQDISTWAKSLTSTWALEMLDSGGKFPSGIAKGNLNSLGNYDQCLGVDNNSKQNRIRGKYCPVNVYVLRFIYELEDYLISLIPLPFPPGSGGPIQNATNSQSSISLLVGLCAPSSCSDQQLQDLIHEVFRNENSTRTLVDMLACSSVDDPVEWTDADVAALVIFSIFGIYIVLSTCYDLIVTFYTKSIPRGHDFLSAFSLYTNTSKLTKISKSSNSIRCIHGIRVMSIFWVMVAHRYASMPLQIIHNLVDVQDWSKKWHSAILVGASVSVDSFLILSGFLLAYVFFQQYEKKKSFNPGLFYLHRFIRLWPAMAAFIFFEETLFKFLGDGPLWRTISVLNADACKEHWWATLLYIQNYFEPQCINHLWYLAIDTQLYILSPILLIPLIKWRKVGIINMVFWILAFQVTLITIVYLNDWGAIFPSDLTYNKQYYTATYMRGGVWLLGFAAGYFVYESRKYEIKMHKGAAFLIWVICLSMMSATIFGAINLYPGEHKVTKLDDGTYNAFARTGWGLCLIWIIFACMHGYGGVINWFLSLRFWELLGRLSYSMYLVHLTVIALYSGCVKTAIHFSDFNMMYIFFGDVFVTGMVAYAWTMAFESPFLAIEKAIFYKKKPVSPAIEVRVTKSEANN